MRPDVDVGVLKISTTLPDKVRSTSAAQAAAAEVTVRSASVLRSLKFTSGSPDSNRATQIVPSCVDTGQKKLGCPDSFFPYTA